MPRRYRISAWCQGESSRVFQVFLQNRHRGDVRRLISRVQLTTVLPDEAPHKGQTPALYITCRRLSLWLQAEHR